MISHEWKKSTRSGTNQGACVEVRRRGKVIEVRDSKNPHQAALTFTEKEWAEFVDGVHNGEFD